MHCPVCGEQLREIEKHGVHIDICPGCKGVWLDRGELEKIIELVSDTPPGAPGVREPARPASSEERIAREYPHPQHYRRHDDDDDDRYEHDYRREDDDRRSYDHDRRHHKPYRKKHWFSEVFEMFGD